MICVPDSSRENEKSGIDVFDESKKKMHILSKSTNADLDLCSLRHLITCTLKHKIISITLPRRIAALNDAGFFFTEIPNDMRRSHKTHTGFC